MEEVPPAAGGDIVDPNHDPDRLLEASPPYRYDYRPASQRGRINHVSFETRAGRELRVPMPSYQIQIYWFDEDQWEAPNRQTTIHSLHRFEVEAREGICIASWGVRRRVPCIWKELPPPPPPPPSSDASEAPSSNPSESSDSEPSEASEEY